MEEYRCIDCGLQVPGKMYGAGDGTGQRFKCPECHWRSEARRLESVEAELRAAHATIAVLKEAVADHRRELERLRAVEAKSKELSEEWSRWVGQDATMAIGAIYVQLRALRAALESRHG